MINHRNIPILVLCTVLLGGAAYGQVNASLNPTSSTTIPEGGAVGFNAGLLTSIGGTHFSSGTLNLAFTGAGIFLGSSSTSISHGSTNVNLSSAVQFFQNGGFNISASGTVAVHNPLHSQIFSGPFSIPGFSISVLNVSPAISSLTDDLEVDVNELFAFSALATDPGINDVLSYHWDFNGDGLDDFVGPSGTHSFPTAGLRPVTVKVLDGDGGEVSDSFNANVIPEPSGMVFLAMGLSGFALRRWRSGGVAQR